MKLQGIILPASLAVSTPTRVPVGALGATVKLLIVIVMNLSGGAISMRATNVRYRFLEHGNGRPFRHCEFLAIACLIYNAIDVNLSIIKQSIPTPL
jgi:hypothetical protein